MADYPHTGLKKNTRGEDTRDPPGPTAAVAHNEKRPWVFPSSVATAKLVRFLISAAPLLLPTSADRGCGVWERWVGKMLQGGRSQITPFSNRQILVDRNNFERDKFWWIPPPGLTTKKGRIETARKGRKRPSPRHHPPTAVVEIPQSSITGALHITPVVSLGSTSVKGWQCVSIVVLPSQQRQQ